MTQLQQMAYVTYACGCTWLVMPGTDLPGGCPEHWVPNRAGLTKMEELRLVRKDAKAEGGTTG